MRYRRTLTVLFIFFLLMSGISTIFQFTEDVQYLNFKDYEIGYSSSVEIEGDYQSREPIIIDSDSDLAKTAQSEGWTGDGSSDDPYIIENFKIDGEGKKGIGVKNTTYYFIIKDCYIYNSSSGIFFSKVKNGVLIDNNISSCEDGIYLSQSSENNIEGNNVSNNGGDGIHDGDGIHLSDNCKNNIIKDNIAFNNDCSGILLEMSSSNTVDNNTVIKNGYGIETSGENTITNNIASNNFNGLDVGGSRCLISHNVVKNNSHAGIYVTGSDNVIRDNIISDNGESGLASDMDFSEVGNTIDNNKFIRNGVYLENNLMSHTITESNTVNGRPIYFWKGKSDDVITSDAGQVILVNCDNITVKDQNLSHCSLGVHIVRSENISVINNLLTNNYYSVFLYKSNDNIIKNNNVSNNKDGIYDIGTRNEIIDNTIYNNHEKGIYIRDDNSIVRNNNISNNDDIGIGFAGENNLIEDNVIMQNRRGIYGGSENNIIKDNIVSFSEDFGIKTEGSRNSILNNKISHNGASGIFLCGEKTTLKNNKMIGNGIRIESIRFREWYYHKIDLSNTVNGKPVYYLQNKSDVSIPSGAGQIILFNCSGIDIEGQNLNNGSVGIQIGNSDNIIINDNNISSNNQYGVHITISENITLSKNKVLFNNQGVILERTIHSSIVNNTVSKNNEGGIELRSAGNTKVRENVLTSNKEYGFRLDSTGKCVLKNNVMKDNGLILFNDELKKAESNIIDTSNTVNGGSIYYLKNRSAETIPSDAGQVILLNCDDMIVENLTLSNCSAGIEILFSNNNIIRNNTIRNVSYGIYIFESSDNIVKNNELYSNHGYGIFLSASNKNRLMNNDVFDFEFGFIIIGSGQSDIPSNNNLLIGNTVSNNEYGIFIYTYSRGDARNNMMYHNNFLNNNKQTFDRGQDNNWYNETLGEGNYWSDYKGTDSDGDGIGDTSYDKINGWGDRIDKYPLMEPLLRVEIGKDRMVKVGEEVVLNVTDIDVYGEVERYVWTIEGEEYESKIVNYSFEEPGNYTITLTVIDEDGNKDNDQITIDVEEIQDDDDKDDLPMIPVMFIIMLIGVSVLFIYWYIESKNKRR